MQFDIHIKLLLEAMSRRDFLGRIGKGVVGAATINPLSFLTKSFSPATPVVEYLARVNSDFMLTSIAPAKEAITALGSIPINLTKNVTAFALHPDGGHLSNVTFTDFQTVLSIKLPAEVAARLTPGSDLSSLAGTYYKGLFNKPKNAYAYTEHMRSMSNYIYNMSDDEDTHSWPEVENYLEAEAESLQHYWDDTMTKYKKYTNAEMPKSIKKRVDPVVRDLFDGADLAAEEIKQAEDDMKDRDTIKKPKVNSSFKTWAQLKMPYHFHSNPDEREDGTIRGVGESIIAYNTPI